MGRFSRRPPGHRLPPIPYRLRQAFHEPQVALESFTTTELDLVRTWAAGGLDRVGRPGPDDEAVQRAWRQLERDKYVGSGRAQPPGEGTFPLEVAATSTRDGSEVVLRGDYAIVSSLRGHPATLLEVRRQQRSGEVDLAVTVYTGVGPDVMLQETAVDDRRDFVLTRADRGGVMVWFWCGVTPEGVDAGPQAVPAAPPLALGEARERCDYWTVISAARPVGERVEVERLVVGSATPGLWMAEPGDDRARVAWSSHTAVSQRLTALAQPPDDVAPWLARPGGPVSAPPAN